MSEEVPEDVGALLRQFMQMLAAGDACMSYAFDVGRAYERSLTTGREIPKRRHRSGRHQPFLLRLVK